MWPTPKATDADRGGRGDLIQAVRGNVSPSGHFSPVSEAPREPLPGQLTLELDSAKVVPMTTTEISQSLADIATGGIALPAAIEYELEDLGLITTDHGPYAKLTDEGNAVLTQAEARSVFGD